MKYFNDNGWNAYLLGYLKEVKKSKKDLPEETNKGIQFEILVEYLLGQMFPDGDLTFKNTKCTHDGGFLGN